MRKPPATFRYTSFIASFSPQRASSTASNIESRPESQPITERLGDPPGLGASSTWISMSTGREPSSPANTALPATLPRRSARNSAEGLATSASPAPVISKTPISSVAPKRFLMPRRMRNWWPRSPSKCSTTSTMCSSTRGPAMLPSLVTCPTSISAKPCVFAARISSNAAARTCVTLPGAESTPSVHIVWIESITTKAASGNCVRLARMSPSWVAAASAIGASVSPSLAARMRI
jgi:hypothetical protein